MQGTGSPRTYFINYIKGTLKQYTLFTLGKIFNDFALLH